MLGFITLGSQTLEELDNQIYWVWDYVLNEQNIKASELKSFFFIENVFYYRLNDWFEAKSGVFEEETDIDRIISKRNNMIYRNFDFNNFSLPDSVLKINEQNQFENKSDNESDELSLNSDNLEPRYQLKVWGPNNKREESKSELGPADYLIQSESHDSYKSSSNQSPKMTNQEKKVIQLIDPANYSNKDPESSFPDWEGKYSK